MVTIQEAKRGLHGAYRLAWLDTGGMQAFDTSIEGYWRSFGAALVALPAYLIIIVLRASQMPEEEALFRFLSIEVISYVAAWVAFPLAAFYITRPLNRGDRYLAYIVAYNWSNVLQIAVYVAVVIIAAFGVVPVVVVSLLNLIAMVAVLGYQWFIARTALGITALAAVGLVFLDFVIGLLINTINLSLHQVGISETVETALLALG